MAQMRWRRLPGAAPRSRWRFRALLLLAVAPSIGAAQAVDKPSPHPYRLTEQRAPCRDHSPERQLFFGDLHVHTAFSYDAVIYGTRNKPADAYRYARGEPMGLHPYDSDGKPLASHRLRQPLDFAAVTDHAETMGLAPVCLTPGAPGYGQWECRLLRSVPWLPSFMPRLLLLLAVRNPQQVPPMCGDANKYCAPHAAGVWQQIIQAAENAYDRSADCDFTSFIAFEWSGSSSLDSNLHRNIIFRNSDLGTVSKPPPGQADIHSPEALRDALERDCLSRPGCDALSIPHNSNLSGGAMFPLGARGAQLSAGEARRWARFEPLLEVMQHKGDSECWFGADELCRYEKLPYGSFRDGKSYSFGGDVPQPKGATGFARTVLAEGLRHERRIGVNPWRFGLLAATDTHLATPGAVEEDDYPGHVNIGRPERLPDAILFNPGGLAGVWAEENTRDALFSALRRREVYGTSGPRMKLRFFGGWDYPDSLCGEADFVRLGYVGGVPMGGELPPRPAAAGAPVFAVRARRAADVSGHVATPLQRVQIIKGWVDGSGEPRSRVYEVAGSPDNGAAVDTATCQRSGAGHNGLCAVWRDPDYQPSQRAYYYARAVENPSCRWHGHACLAKGVDCSAPDTVPRALRACCDARYDKAQQERAWSSPIWLAPQAGRGPA